MSGSKMEMLDDTELDAVTGGAGGNVLSGLNGLSLFGWTVVGTGTAHDANGNINGGDIAISNGSTTVVAGGFFGSMSVSVYSGK